MNELEMLRQEAAELRRLLKEKTDELASWNALPSTVMNALLGDLLDRCVAVVRAQPNYPDTHTGTRQQWVRDQITEKLLALPLISEPRS